MQPKIIHIKIYIMSCFKILYNSRHKMMVPVKSKDEYISLRDSAKQVELVKKARTGDKEAKKHLLQFNYSCLPNSDGTLSGSRHLSNSVGMDIDHIASDKMEQVAKRIIDRKDQLGLLMLERSASGDGYHLVFCRNMQLNQEKNLKWAAKLLDVAYDEGAKDCTRVFFATTASRDDLLFISDKLFSEDAAEVAEVPAAAELPQSTSEPKKADIVTGEPTEKSLRTFEICRELADLKDVDINKEGSRHSSLKAIMSAGASRLLEKEELLNVVAECMPSFIGEPDCLTLVNDFYEKYGDKTKPYSLQMIRMNAKAEKLSREEAEKEDGFPPLPELPKKLPKLIELLVSRTPEEYKAAVAHAVFPPLATHLCNTRFKYIDNVEHEATLMCCLMAGTGAGKSCVSKPISYIMADIRERDRVNLAREKEWKDSINLRGANKEGAKRPDDLIIQEIDADMTNPAFVMRTAEAQGHFLYTSLNELDQFDALKGTGQQQFRIMCLAFDPDNQYGQTRVGTQSVTERVTVRFNWNASTTIKKGQRYFSSVVTDGPLSRINFCMLPERAIGAPIPVYGEYGEDFTEALKPYIDNLCNAEGLVSCPEAYALAQALQQENADFSVALNSRTFENFSFRANVIAYLKACVLYVANGQQWEPEMEDFIRWSEEYDLWCKMRFFGAAVEHENKDTSLQVTRRGPGNMLLQLPDTFTIQQAKDVAARNELTPDGTRQMVRNWLNRKHIYVLAPDGTELFSMKQINEYKKNNQKISNQKFSFVKRRFFTGDAA